MNPLRSLLYTPGTRPDRLEKAWREAAADVVVADLEDAVAPADKAQARQAVVQALQAVPSAACVRAVRINAWPGDLASEDLAAILPHRPDWIVLPKAEDPARVQELVAGLPEPTQVALLLETAAGVLRAGELAACARVAAVAFGAEDLAADAGLARSAGNVEVAVPRALIALAAAAHRVAAFDMVVMDLADEARCRREAREAVALGYSGKMCIHPRQVQAVHEELAPTPETVAWARRIDAAAREAGAAEGGIVVVDGTMVDVPVVRQARRILARAGL